MKARNLVVAGITALGVLTSCDKDLVTYKEDDIKVLVTKGDEWLHDFPLFLGIEKKNPPFYQERPNKFQHLFQVPKMACLVASFSIL